MMNTPIQSLLAVSLSLMAMAASAAVVSYNSQAGFNAAVGTTATDGFNDLAAGLQFGSVARTAGASAYQASVDDVGGYGAANGGNDFYTVDGGAGNIWLSTAVAESRMVFSGFGAGVRGIGGAFFASDVNGAFRSGGSFTLTLTDLLGSTSVDLNNVLGTNGFFGLVSTEDIVSFSIVTKQPVGANPGDAGSYRYTTLDQLTVGSAAAVPEPASVGLVLIALALAAGAARRAR